MTRKLEEQNYDVRTYYTTSLTGTTDGLFSVPVRRLKMMVVNDSLGGQIEIHFQDKPQKTVGP